MNQQRVQFPILITEQHALNQARVACFVLWNFLLLHKSSESAHALRLVADSVSPALCCQACSSGGVRHARLSQRPLTAPQVAAAEEKGKAVITVNGNLKDIPSHSGIMGVRCAAAPLPLPICLHPHAPLPSAMALISCLHLNVLTDLCTLHRTQSRDRLMCSCDCSPGHLPQADLVDECCGQSASATRLSSFALGSMPSKLLTEKPKPVRNSRGPD